MVAVASRFPLPWSHYVRLLAVCNPEARRFYETEALRGGWTIRQLNRQIGSQFYQRTILSKNKAAMLEGLPNKVLAAEYRTALPEERLFVEEIEKTRRQLETRSWRNRPKAR